MCSNGKMITDGVRIEGRSSLLVLIVIIALWLGGYSRWYSVTWSKAVRPVFILSANLCIAFGESH